MLATFKKYHLQVANCIRIKVFLSFISFSIDQYRQKQVIKNTEELSAIVSYASKSKRAVNDEQHPARRIF